MPDATDAAFRPATPDDVAALLELVRAFYDEDGQPFQEGPARAALEALVRGPALGRAWILEAAGEPLGYSVLTFGFSLEFLGRDAFVDELFVRPSHRGSGLGRKALELAEAACREEGVTALHLEVGREKTAAQGLYRRFGFVDRSHHIMTKRLR